MQPAPPVLTAVAIAGVACRIECPDAAFASLLAERFAGFHATGAPELLLRVELRAPDGPGLRRPGPFARLGGADGVLTIEGAGFHGSFDERRGEGVIVQPPDPSPLEAFLTAIYAGRLLRAGGFFLHAAALVGEDGARVFFGPSGSGKTTVAELVGEGVISDETVALRPDGDGWRASAVPWRGTPLEAPVAGLFRLEKARATAFRRLAPVEALRQLLPSVLFSRADAGELDRFLDIAGSLARGVPCWAMRFAPDRGFWDALDARARRSGP